MKPFTKAQVRFIEKAIRRAELCYEELNYVDDYQPEDVATFRAQLKAGKLVKWGQKVEWGGKI